MTMGSQPSVLFQPMDNGVFDLKNGVKMMHVRILAAGVAAAVVVDADAVMMTMMMMVSIVHVASAVASIDAQSNPCY